MKTTFIYRLEDPRVDPDDVRRRVRYVGKAHRPQVRMNGHIQHARNGRRWPVSFWIRELLAIGMEPLMRQRQVPFDDWKQYEREWIAFYRGKGCLLLNATIGGDGFSSEEAKKHWSDPEYRKKFNEGMKNSDKRRWSEKIKKHWSDPEKRRARSNEVKEHWSDPEYRRRQSESHKRYFSDPENRRRQSESQRKRFSDPERRRMHSEMLKRYHARKKARNRRPGIIELFGGTNNGQ